MIIDLAGTEYTLPDREVAEQALYDLEWSQESLSVLTDDPHLWISLVQSVHNALYRPAGVPEGLYLQQVVLAYQAVVRGVQQAMEGDR